ncbi:hypothetical protein J2X69_000989 [Algoriphagus sp. 4150]|nr:hypothetical protein [Algoriphagus sp. 4150]
MIIRNDTSSHIFLALLAGRPMTDDRSSLLVPMAIEITKSYIAFASLPVEKRIYSKNFNLNLCKIQMNRC